MPIPSLHIIASRDMGGAERWFVRFLHAMVRAGEPVEAVVRASGALASGALTGIATATLPMRTVWDPLSRWQVSRHARASAAPIVQTYMGRASRLTRLPVGRDQIHVARLGGYYGLHAFRHAHAWIGNTRALCDWMVREGLPSRRVFYITNFADPPPPAAPGAVAALRARIGVADDEWLVLHPARFVAVKGHTTLLAAFARLPREVAGRRPRLVLLGDGPLREALHAQARELGLAARVVWAGWQHDPAPWFDAADLVAFPSRDNEALGNVILEAWSHQRPIVATAFRGAREITRPGEDAWIVPCNDVAALAHGLETLMRDDGLRAALITRGAGRVTSDFGEAAVITRYRELYALLLGR